jgi:hypothetical protein
MTNGGATQTGTDGGGTAGVMGLWSHWVGEKSQAEGFPSSINQNFFSTSQTASSIAPKQLQGTLEFSTP